jgi:hypothetical protein
VYIKQENDAFFDDAPSPLIKEEPDEVARQLLGLPPSPPPPPPPPYIKLENDAFFDDVGDDAPADAFDFFFPPYFGPEPPPPAPRLPVRTLPPLPPGILPQFGPEPPRQPPVLTSLPPLTRPYRPLPPRKRPPPPPPPIEIPPPPPPEPEIDYSTVPLEDIRPQKKKSSTVRYDDDIVSDVDDDDYDDLQYRQILRAHKDYSYPHINAERESLRREAEQNIPLRPELIPDPKYDLFPTDPYEDAILFEDLMNYATVPFRDIEANPAERSAVANIVKTLSGRYRMFEKLVQALKVTYGEMLSDWFRPFLWLVANGILSQIKRLDDTPPERRNEAYYTIDQLCGMLLWAVR